MKSRIGRPKLKAKERKEIFPLRLSALELKAIKDTAGSEPLSKWMRRTLLAAVPSRHLAAVGLTSLLTEAIKSGGPVILDTDAPSLRPTAPMRSPKPRAAESRS